MGRGCSKHSREEEIWVEVQNGREEEEESS